MAATPRAITRPMVAAKRDLRITCPPRGYARVQAARWCCLRFLERGSFCQVLQQAGLITRTMARSCSSTRSEGRDLGERVVVRVAAGLRGRADRLERSLGFAPRRGDRGARLLAVEREQLQPVVELARERDVTTGADVEVGIVDGRL